jgi:hypothetical protein
MCLYLQIEKVLVIRLEKALKYWTKLILKSPAELNVISEEDSIYSPKISVNNKNFGGKFSFKNINFKLLIKGDCSRNHYEESSDLRKSFYRRGPRETIQLFV